MVAFVSKYMLLKLFELDGIAKKVSSETFASDTLIKVLNQCIENLQQGFKFT